MVLFAVSSFTCSMPHFIFGKQLIHANDLLFSGVVSTHPGKPPPGSQLDAMMNTSAPAPPVPPNICRAPSAFAEHVDEDWDTSKYNSSVPWSTRLKYVHMATPPLKIVAAVRWRRAHGPCLPCPGTSAARRRRGRWSSGSTPR